MNKEDFIVGQSYTLDDLKDMVSNNKYLPKGIAMIYKKNRAGNTGCFEYQGKDHLLYYRRFSPATQSTQPTLQLFPSLNS